MKTEELRNLGLTDEQIKFVMAENGKDINELKKNLADVTSERDNFKEKATNAEETLKKFDGVDVEAMKAEVESWKVKAEESEKAFNQKIYDRDYNDALTTALSGIKFTSESAKKSVMKDIKDAGLVMKEGKILGLNDLIDSIKSTDASAFVDEEAAKLEEGKAKFTVKDTIDNQGGITKESIMAIKDRDERRKAIAENIGLFS